MANRPSRPMHRTGARAHDLDACIRACDDCARICLHTLTQHCLEHGGEHTEPERVRILLDCAGICRTSADFLSRGSSYHHLACGTCAQICQACAESCAAIGDAEMNACAAVCRACAEPCQRMSATPAA
jgi:hypothetical protein